MTIGYILIAIAFIAAIFSATAYAIYYRDQSQPMLQMANRAFYVLTGAAGIALLLLIYLIATHDFQVNYVYSYSSRILNKYYLFSTLWAGQEGTFLMWLFFGCIYGLILIRTVAQRNPLTMFFLLLVQGVLLLILLKKNPFLMIWHVHDTAPVGFMPADGAGLNPLLQNPWMVIHPPTLFVGYSSTVVAFVFAASALVTGKYSEWIKDVRPWVIFNVMILGTGIMMGGYWAYTTLGWGGYWAWDPVENASIVPWLFSLLLMHGIVIQSKRKALIRTNLLWGGLAFVTMLWGSFLTRSGVLTDFSVHSFAPSGLLFYLVSMQVLFTFGFLGVYAYRFLRKSHESEPVEFGDGFLNRETMMFAGMMIILFLALFVLVGTSAPLYTGWFGKATSISPDFYNAMGIPIVTFMFVALSVAPLLAWKTSQLRNGKILSWSIGIAAVATVVAIFAGLGPLEGIGGGTAIYGPQEGSSVMDSELLRGLVFAYILRYSPYVLFFLSVTVIAVNSQIGFRFLKNNFPKAGGYLVHVGLGFAMIGILTSSVYDTSEKVMLPRGKFAKMDMGYEIKFENFVPTHDGRDFVKLVVRSPFGNEYEAYPRFYYSEYNKAYMVSPDVKVQFAKDVYISPISFTPARLANQRVLDLRKKQTGLIDDLQVTFTEFNVTMEGNSQRITANLAVKPRKDVAAEAVQIKPLLISTGSEMTSQPIAVPGSEMKVKINSVSAAEGSVQLAFLMPDKAGEQRRDMIAVEVSEKPFISVLWFGTILFIIGSFVSMLNRRRRKG